jgi:hypothetical protein
VVAGGAPSRVSRAAGFATLAAANLAPASAAAAEAVTLGQGEYRYRVVEGWGDLPPGYTYRDGAAVCVDSKENVYVFNRGAHPVNGFDRDGKFLGSWARTSGSSTPTAPPWDRTTWFISPMISAPRCANARCRARWC